MSTSSSRVTRGGQAAEDTLLRLVDYFEAVTKTTVGADTGIDVNIIGGTVTASIGAAFDYGVSSAAIRTASQVGNASGAAAFGAGATSAQTLRVVLPTDQTAIPASQSGTWNITNISGTVSLPTGASTLAEQQTQTTALQLIDNLVLTQSSTTSGQSGILSMAAVSNLNPTLTDAQTSPLSLTTAGSLRTYDETNYIQNIVNAGYLSNIDSNIFTMSGYTSNLTTMTTAYVLNNAFATGRGVPAMAEYDDTSTDVPSGDDRVYMLRMTANRGLHINPRTSGGSELFTTTDPGAVHGTGAAGTAPGNPVSMAMVDLTTGLRAIPNTFPFSGAQFQLCLVPDLFLNFPIYNADGSQHSRTGSPDGTLANAVYLATDSSRNQLIVGNVAHDATDASNPVKIGGKATALTSEPTAVSASGDRVDAYYDTKGYAYTKDNAYRSTITQLFNAQVFNNTTTTANSTSFDCTRFRYLVVYAALTESGAATDIRLRAQFDRGSGNWFDWYVDHWTDLRYVTAQMPLSEIIPINQVVGTTFRIRADATGTTAVNTITLSLWVEGIT